MTYYLNNYIIDICTLLYCPQSNRVGLCESEHTKQTNKGYSICKLYSTWSYLQAGGPIAEKNRGHRHLLAHIAGTHRQLEPSTVLYSLHLTGNETRAVKLMRSNYIVKQGLFVLIFAASALLSGPSRRPSVSYNSLQCDQIGRSGRSTALAASRWLWVGATMRIGAWKLLQLIARTP